MISLLAALLLALGLVSPVLAAGAGEDNDVGDGPVPLIIIGVVVLVGVVIYAVDRMRRAETGRR
jgi:membrane protein DedA with SNARE-associated domain